MRYLWVEDFNDESNNDTGIELQERLEDFFDLKNDKLIIERDLSSAIKFLEDSSNFDKIDAILIDIRFPEGKTDDLYRKYFRDIVTPKFYEENINDASGIMLYLLLIFRYHVSQEKIAFVSANVSNDNDKIKRIQEMIEIIIKSKYELLSDNDKAKYRTIERNVGKNILDISSNEKEWPTFISKENQVEDVDYYELISALRELPRKYYEKFESLKKSDYSSNAQKKYTDVKHQFEKIGFVMPCAFEKPIIGEEKKKRYLFFEWERELYSNTYTAVRSSILEMCLILIEYLNKSDKEFYTDFMNLLICNEEEKEYYDADFFRSYLENIKSIFRIESTENLEILCERVIKEISALWEGTAVPKGAEERVSKHRSGELVKRKAFFHNDNCYFAVHAVMKITRNWIGHQGIKNIDIIDIGFLFLISMRGIFDIESMREDFLISYKEYESKILNLFEIDEEINAKINKEIKEVISDSLEYFCRLNEVTKAEKNTSRDIYGKISGMGHSQSRIRREVSIDDIYMLMYHILMIDNRYDRFVDIAKSIETRTWKNWKQRYDERFEKYISC